MIMTMITNCGADMIIYDHQRENGDVIINKIELIIVNDIDLIMLDSIIE
jgi:hypothetical protein